MRMTLGQTSGWLGAMTVGAILAVGCGVKAPVSDDFSELETLDQKSDAFSSHMKIVGSLTYGQTSGKISYKNPPRYRAFKFAGQKGDKVDVWVRASGSSQGDAIVWILDNKFKTIAMNDDADDTTLDAHATVTLPASKSATHYIVFRDYYLNSRTFTVSLGGQTDFYSCNVDADCAIAAQGCCAMGSFVGVRADAVDAYHDSLNCPANLMCPMVKMMDQGMMAECISGQCAAVKGNAILCGGRSTNPHVCADGWLCAGDGLAVDAPGNCYRRCGGLVGTGCYPGYSCVDYPNDGCDPANGGADCMGMCVAAPADCSTNGCADGQYCSLCWGSYQCIPTGAVC